VRKLGRVPASVLRRGSPDPMLCLRQLYGIAITTTTWLEVGTNYVDNTVQSGQIYYYVVTAEGTNGLESVYSARGAMPMLSRGLARRSRLGQQCRSEVPGWSAKVIREFGVTGCALGWGL